MSLLATVVDWSALGQTVLASLIAGVGVALSFSIGILGASKLSDPSRELGLPATLAFGAVTIFGLVATIAAIAFGLVVMVS
jgi:hypothetical protein